MLPLCRRLLVLAIYALLPFGAAGQLTAETAPPVQQLLKPEELDALVAPIALYPDTLLALVLMASAIVPKMMNRLTPNIDEEKEIARGNVAVAEYFGRVVGGCIIGVSIVIAAAILGGILAGLM